LVAGIQNGPIRVHSDDPRSVLEGNFGGRITGCFWRGLELSYPPKLVDIESPRCSILAPVSTIKQRRSMLEIMTALLLTGNAIRGPTVVPPRTCRAIDPAPDNPVNRFDILSTAITSEKRSARCDLQAQTRRGDLVGADEAKDRSRSMLASQKTWIFIVSSVLMLVFGLYNVTIAFGGCGRV
jgi:hypothetical protein